MYDESYRDLVTQYYDLDKPAAPPEYLAGIRHWLPESPTGAILEPMCGSGRALVPLAQAGWDITGVDASSQMLAACDRKCAKAGVSPPLHRQRLQAMKLEAHFAYAFIYDASLALLTDQDELREALHRIHAHLLPGGRFLVGLETPASREASSRESDDSSGIQAWGAPWVERPDGARILMTWPGGRYDPDTGTSESIGKYELFRDGELLQTEFQAFRIRYYPRSEFQGHLEAVGFQVEHCVRMNTTEDATDDDPEISFVCRKPG